jgi:hypothetical protein
MRGLPFFLSALFFLSAVFSIFSPLPILFLYFRGGRRWAFLAGVSNGLLVFLAGGLASLAVYGIFVLALAFALAVALDRRASIEKAAAAALLCMALMGGAVVGAYSARNHVNPAAEFRKQVVTWADALAQNAPEGAVDPAEMDEWKQDLKAEFPSAIAVFALLLVWANLVLLLRLNPMGLRERLGLEPGYLKTWRAPDWLIWPALLSFAGILLNLGPASEVAMNVFKFLMGIYVIQGLSILSFVFDLWNIRGFFRAIGFLIAAFLMTPLLLAVGFFDLWFDFRAKFRQT